MKIILVAAGAKGRNVVFVSDTLRAYTVEETVRLAKEEKLMRHKDPHDNPEANERGFQIAGEFYQLAKEWLQ